MELEKTLKKILDNLSEPFVSEADFQFYLAWKLQCEFQKAEIILEYPFKEKTNDGKDKNQYYDIFIKQGKQKSFIELKYKTKEDTILRYDEVFYLKGQEARDFGNYYFIKDIQRMEKMANKSSNFCIFLTNDPGYWKEKTTKKKDGKYVIDSEYKLYDSKSITGYLKWDPSKNHTQKKPGEDIELKGIYRLEWEPIKISKKKQNWNGNIY